MNDSGFNFKELTDIPKKLVKIKIILIVCSIVIPLLLLVIIVSIFAAGGFGDIDFSSSNGSGQNCTESGFTLKDTSLSKEEFVQKLTAYASSSGMNSVFTEFAEDIYTKSKAKNINPEVVVVRAIAESGGKNETAPYNYWGINCKNTGGGKDCESFPDFGAAVDRFLDIASKYSSLSDMMSKYSYIGEYWYSPGGAGLGGCYYASHIYPSGIPTRVQTACQSICSPDNTASCIKTTDEDQKAYSDWQVKTNMGGIRKTVFGLDATSGVVCTGNGNLPELTNYNLKHNGLEVLNRTLSDTERSDLDSYIDSQISKAGYGTGAGIAAAGQSLIYWLEQKGFYLQYYWGGGHGGYGDSNTSFVYSNPNWGTTSLGADTHNGNYRPYFGMDCSGFVSWATRTACKNGFEHTSGYWTGTGKHISLSEAKPGDVLDHGGHHVILIIKNNGDGSVITAEESGSNRGLVFTKYSSAGSYVVVNMQDWYASNCDRKGK